MKKTLLLAAGLFALTSANADEGMWTLYNLPDPVYEQMVAEGFQLPCDELYSSDNSLKNCVVNFSGYCSGVVVSPDGLVFTNHHCGFSAINSHSTVDHDYMLNGFYAKSYEEELPNENMFVSFMKEQRDITKRVAPLLEGKSVLEQADILDSLTNHLTDSIKQIDSTLHIDVDPFYEGNKYYATTYQDFRDLRLVFTVPKSMGKFGGETDNWMWPRQTCDFSVFRIYADPKTNGPADYSKDNVPYHPKSWAQVSLQGYKDGDFSMTVGYPGSTSRYLSSYGITEMRNAENTPRVLVRGVKQAIMERYMNADEKTRINYEDAYVGSANYWKNAMGMNKCIDSIGIVEQKEAYEKKIAAWQDTTTCGIEKVDFARLKDLYARRFDSYRTLNYWNECFRRNTQMFTRAISVAQGSAVVNPDAPEEEQYIAFEDNADTWNYDLDKEQTAAMLKTFAQQVPIAMEGDVFKTIQKKFKGDYNKYVDWLYKKSKLMQPGVKLSVGSGKKLIKDPGVALGVDLFSVYLAAVFDYLPLTDSIQAEEKALCAAKLRMEEDLPHYSDANFTMRLSYGQVGGYLLGGVNSGYYTPASSILAKMDKGDKNADYAVQPEMRELLSRSDFGRYADKTNKTLQLCFLTNNDITGGNSGSPMFDGKGRLIGLAFDGNWDSLSSDINFDARLARCIGVDIRYVLYMMDQWGHADRLLKEINPVE